MAGGISVVQLIAVLPVILFIDRLGMSTTSIFVPLTVLTVSRA